MMIIQNRIKTVLILAAMAMVFLVLPAAAEIPDQLPDPDTTPPDTTKPVKVFILSGQSNMVGMGNVTGTQPGTLETITTGGMFPHLVDAAGAWTVRNDVWYKGVVTATANKWLTVGCGSGASAIGPELQFGHIMGYCHDEPVIVLKASQGNRALGWDILPPGSEQYTVGGWTYPGYGGSPERWPEGTTPVPIAWYAGKEYDTFVTAIHGVLDNFDTHFPQYKDQGYEIAGFAWWQGHRDGLMKGHADRYELNLVNFIKAFRAEFDVPNAPFVLATIAFGGWEMAGNNLTVANAQLAVSGETGNYPEFAGNVLTVESRDYWREVAESPANQGYHYNRNAETFMLVGDALGRGMAEILTPYSVDADVDMITWSDKPVELDATVQDGVTVTSYAWSAAPADGVVFDSNSIEDPTVTITKPALTLTADTIVNPGFEEAVLADGGWESNPPAWTNGYYDVTTPTVWVVGDSGGGAYNPTAADGYGGVAPEGDNVILATSGAGYDKGMSQVLSGNLQANTQYDLSALVGNPSLWNFAQNESTTTADYRIELLAGGVVLASDTGDSPVDHTTSFITAGLTYNSGASPAQLGEALEIRLLAVDFTDGYQVDFDDVKLTAEGPTPDPYTVALTLTVSDGENPPVTDTMTIDVYDDACKAAIGKGLAADNPGDINGDCKTSLEDLAEMAAKWLNDTGLAGPQPK